MSGLWLIVAGFFGATSVGAGAYGWHSLGENDSIRQIFMMGVDYQMWHALALIGVSWIASQDPFKASRLPLLAGLSFSLGIILFSGTLYLYALIGYVPVEGAAPVGGWLMMAGWVTLIVCGWKTRKVNHES
ncbi:MAG: DUF423 domain-containing protein [Rhodospirillaceae bacterium]|nr:DUF423 domain-containing protein [Rhodospirillaceae bacterium]MBL6940680.1 DUF423 domain-containing protein [Rhodospirillales bacterium]